MIFENHAALTLNGSHPDVDPRQYPPILVLLLSRLWPKGKDISCLKLLHLRSAYWAYKDRLKPPFCTWSQTFKKTSHTEGDAEKAHPQANAAMPDLSHIIAIRTLGWPKKPTGEVASPLDKCCKGCERIQAIRSCVLGNGHLTPLSDIR